MISKECETAPNYEVPFLCCLKNMLAKNEDLRQHEGPQLSCDKVPNARRIVNDPLKRGQQEARGQKKIQGIINSRPRYLFLETPILRPRPLFCGATGTTWPPSLTFASLASGPRKITLSAPEIK